MSEKQIYIFGAHSRSQTLGVYLQRLYPQIRIAGYLVDNEEPNPNSVDGVSVIHIDREHEVDTALPVYLGTRSIYHKQITEHLEKLSFREIVPVTVEMDIALRNRYMEEVFFEADRKFDKISNNEETKLTSCLYIVKSINDKELSTFVELEPYERLIQVGCSLTEDRLSECVCFDDAGCSISNRNQQFCELTALYWVWKNAKEDVVGLEHYRRHFTLPEGWLARMIEREIDVILPVPLYVHPSLAENYRKRHTDFTWDAMMSVLRRNPEEYIVAQDFFEHTGCYSPCNMLIAKRRVLDELCRWLFPIVFEVAGQIGEIDDPYQNRYPGFLTERLITFFFYEHRDQYRVVYADKDFLQ